MSRSIYASLAIQERQDNEKAARDSRQRQEREAVQVGKRETITLRLARGEVIDQPQAGRGERDKPAKIRDGWDLARADYIRNGHLGLVNVGDWYSEQYRTAWGSGMKCNSVPIIRGAKSEHEAADVIARRELAKVNSNALASLKPLIEIVERICGKGEYLLNVAREKQHIAVHKERLTNALMLIGVHRRMEV